MEKRITAIIVDDEAKSRNVLKKLLLKFCPEIEICGEAEDVDEAFSLIGNQKPNLVFLDIQMPGENGFALLKKFTTLPFDVIFVTSYDKYAINAIKFSALDYLLKPVEVYDLKEAVKKAIQKKLTKANNETQIINLLNTIESKEIEKKVAVHSGGKVVLLKVSDIECIEANGRYSNISTNTSENYVIPKTVKDFEEYLHDNPAFIRIHKSCIININFIKDYIKGEQCIVLMRNGKEFEVSRRKKQEVLERLRM